MVEGTGLENRQAGNRLVGSNPTPSASYTDISGFLVPFSFYIRFYTLPGWTRRFARLRERGGSTEGLAIWHQDGSPCSSSSSRYRDASGSRRHRSRGDVAEQQLGSFRNTAVEGATRQPHLSQRSGASASSWRSRTPGPLPPSAGMNSMPNCSRVDSIFQTVSAAPLMPVAASSRFTLAALSPAF